MEKKTIQFSRATTSFYFSGSFADLEKLAPKHNAILLTDENIFAAHGKKFKDWNTIVLKAGEQYKVQATVDSVIDQMIAMKADRTTTLVGIGGGVVTDMAGYIAGIYMRGIRFGFLPASILAMVDASIGGKNGIDVGVYKNMVGMIRQPDFLLYDVSLLKSLPNEEWVNGMAEVIKHAAIKDAPMFSMLEETSLPALKKDPALLSKLIRRNALLKTKVVQKDEFEKGERRLLNFGHTIGHAIENMYELKHGHAVAVGMMAAAGISEKLTGFKESDRLSKLIRKYRLPHQLEFDKNKALEILGMDKKREKDTMNFVLLQKTGKAVVHPIPMPELKEIVLAL
ncbi:3-dehydroquinate synthase [Parasegetibacter sp. NRK P23]|uniref:3-dehydroquinate synthase n=1 Tax=Parasegetibacter sp. NRK P23 TaxID=2942999 RepID=UPI002042E7AE|nr:3-dehydroquinate synthase [Parasegetibacter sp. NRK P23]MCM5528470.1 3-dehydroquinate synthase [Parasegetibacter sp. NRK P23]